MFDIRSSGVTISFYILRITDNVIKIGHLLCSKFESTCLFRENTTY